MMKQVSGGRCFAAGDSTATGGHTDTLSGIELDPADTAEDPGQDSHDSVRSELLWIALAIVNGTAVVATLASL